MQVIKQELCERCKSPIPPTRGDGPKRFCSHNCNVLYKIKQERLKSEYHAPYMCPCSFCKVERNLYQKLRNMIYPWKRKQYRYPYKKNYVLSERNLVK